MKPTLPTVLTLGLGLLFASPSTSPAAEPKQKPPANPVEAKIQQANAAYARGDYPGALAIVDALVKEHPNNAQIHFYRGQLHGALGGRAGNQQVAVKFHAKAAADFGEVLRLNPRSAAALQERGSANFRQAKIEESIRDWDRFIELVPSREPYHWQRGIAHYYAGKYDLGRKQFELHQTVNSADVENAVFHFICTARGAGLPEAKANFIPIKGDRRVPMMEIHGLFAGTKSVADVLKAAQAGEGEAVKHQLFYAHYYVALFHEAHGNHEQAAEHVAKAVKHAPLGNYMGDCARVHAMLLARKKK